MLDHQPLDPEKFLNTLKNLSASFLAGTADQKNAIAQNMLLKLIIKDGK